MPLGRPGRDVTGGWSGCPGARRPDRWDEMATLRRKSVGRLRCRERKSSRSEAIRRPGRPLKPSLSFAAAFDVASVSVPNALAAGVGELCGRNCIGTEGGFGEPTESAPRCTTPDLWRLVRPLRTQSLGIGSGVGPARSFAIGFRRGPEPISESSVPIAPETAEGYGDSRSVDPRNFWARMRAFRYTKPSTTQPRNLRAAPSSGASKRDAATGRL
jgi:hypothetical protein